MQESGCFAEDGTDAVVKAELVFHVERDDRVHRHCSADVLFKDVSFTGLSVINRADQLVTRQDVYRFAAQLAALTLLDHATSLSCLRITAATSRSATRASSGLVMQLDRSP